MRKALLASLVAAAVAAPAMAGADVLLTPYAGVNFSGSTVDHRAVVGGSVTFIGSSGFGLEVDLGFIPDFFAPRDLDIDVLGANNVTTVMGSLVFAGRRGGVQPYLAAGAGLIRTKLGDFGELFDAAASNLGVNARRRPAAGRRTGRAPGRRPLLPQPDRHRRAAARSDAGRLQLLARHTRDVAPVLAVGAAAPRLVDSVFPGQRY